MTSPAPRSPASSDSGAPIGRYLTHLRVERRLAARTLALYTDALARLQAGAAELGATLATLTPAHVRRLAARLHAQGLSPRSIALHLSAWRGFYRWWGREPLADVRINPVDGVRAPKAAQPLPKALAVDQAVQLAAHQPTDAGDARLLVRDHAICELLYSSGLRIAELVALDVHASGHAAGWIDLPDATAHVLGKGSKRRTVPVGAPALAALQAWLAVRTELAKAGDAALFVGRRGGRLTDGQIRQRLKRLGQSAGLATPVHPHMLRHSAASHLLQSSGDLRAVQEFLGHADIATTQIYTRLDFQHLAKVYDAAHPHARRKGG